MLYFAYGSNLHPERLRRRVPSRETVAVATLANHELTFSKRGGDGSGKCAVLPCDGACVYGVLYRMAAAERPRLDRAEGVHLGGYRAVDVSVTLGADEVQALTYLPAMQHIDPALRPFDWYKAFVVSGARHHALPAAWIAHLDAVSTMEDPVAERAALNGKILAQLASAT